MDLISGQKESAQGHHPPRQRPRALRKPFDSLEGEPRMIDNNLIMTQIHDPGEIFGLGAADVAGLPDALVIEIAG